MTIPPWLAIGADVDVPASWLEQITVAQVVAAVALAALIVTLIIKVRKAWLPVGMFLEDWSGEPQRPGVPARPGVMARLDAIEQHLSDSPTRREIAEILQHLALHDRQVAELYAIAHRYHPEERT